MTKKLYKCKYPDCSTEQAILSKGLCSFHRYKQKGSPMKAYILKQSRKNKLKKEDKREILEPFFEYHLEQVQKSPYCDNCGMKLTCNTTNLAHILPKRFGGNPEVMGELNNCIYLCASVSGGIGCHERFDRIQGSSQVYLMNCWAKAVDKYLTFREKVVKYTKYVVVFEDYIKENGN